MSWFLRVAIALMLAGPQALADGLVSGREAFGELQKGNTRFSSGKPVRMTSKSPRPHTIVLTCSESTVSPELVLDQGLGDLYVVRTAGHVLNSQTIGSIEYAIENLGVSLLLVMGHDSCQVVKAAVDTPNGSPVASPNWNQVIGKISPHLHRDNRSVATSGDYHWAVEQNVTATMKELMKRSKIVREAVKKEELMLVQGVYSPTTNKVKFWELGEKFASTKSDSPPTPVVEKKTEKTAPAAPRAPAAKTKPKPKKVEPAPSGSAWGE